MLKWVRGGFLLLGTALGLGLPTALGLIPLLKSSELEGADLAFSPDQFAIKSFSGGLAFFVRELLSLQR